MKKVITRAEYLTALGLFTLASSHMRMVEQCEKELGALLGFEDDSTGFPYLECISDEIYTRGGGTLDVGLKKEGITVEHPSPEERESELDDALTSETHLTGE